MNHITQPFRKTTRESARPEKTLAMGWLILGVLPALMTAVGFPQLLLLISGGIVYSLGTALQAHGKLLFHNAVWHAMVVVAAALHYEAVVLLLSAGS